MRRGFVVALLLLFIGLPAWAWDISPNDIQPTQPYAGFDNMQDMVGRWKAEAAKTIGKSTDQLTLNEWRGWVTGTLKPRMAGKTIPGIIDTNGDFRNLDAHHTVGALQLVFRETGVDFQLPTDVQADFRGKASRDVDHWFNERGLSFPARPIKRSHPGASARWPVRFEEIQDSPLRSAVGNALYNLGIDSVNGKPYLEFTIANLLEANGIVPKLKKLKLIGRQESGIPSGKGTDPEVVAVVQRMILSNKAVASFMQTEAPIERRADIAQQYKAAKQRFGKEVAQMPAEKRQAEVSLLQMLGNRLPPTLSMPRKGAYQPGTGAAPRVRGVERSTVKFNGSLKVVSFAWKMRRQRRPPSARPRVTFNRLLHQQNQ